MTNGGFETSSLTGWTLGGAKVPIASTAHPHAGTYALRCGATTASGSTEPSGDSYAYQTVTIPAGATQATLSFWYYAYTTDTVSYDWQDAQVRDSSGSVLINIFHMADNGQVWTQKTVDLTAYAGRTVQLYFNAHGDGYTDPTTLWVDDVTLNVTTTSGIDGGTGGTDAGTGGTRALTNGVALTGLSGAAGSSTYFTLAVPAGATNLKFTTGTGTSSTNDEDLYVRFGSQPTTSTYDCRSINVGNTESCSITTAQAGTYYVMLYGYQAYSSVTLTGSYTAPSGGGTDGGTSGGGGGGNGASISVHTTLGIPDNSTTSTTNPNHYLSVKHQYVISYNGSHKTPNWSSWELNTSWMGSTARQDTFRPDDTLPTSIPQAALSDYSGSGYDRGHMCPSADRTLTVTDNSATFYLTNMVPQAPNNNQGPWEQLETYARNLATSGKELFIISGPIYSGTPATIGAGVAVPTSTWKVITVLDHVGDGPAQVTTSTRVIAVIMPNDNSQIAKTDDWHNFRVTVRQIEQQTGLNIMSDVAQSVQDVIETKVDTAP